MNEEKTSTDLTLIPQGVSAMEVFKAENGLDPYLSKIKEELDDFQPDTTTKKGRDAIASMAHKVARAKTALDNIGKDLVADLKDVPKRIDAERKRMRDLLDQWKDDVRKPLTEWEESEKARVAMHQNNIETIREAVIGAQTEPSSALQARISELQAMVIDATWQEFETEAHRVKAETLEVLHAALEKRTAYEAEQAELSRLRAEAAAREQQEREARLVREAEERARLQAEQQAQAERDAVALRESQAKAAADQRERDLQLAAERAQREKLEAQQREAQAKANADDQAQRAAAAERQRIADEQDAAERARLAREADTAHRGAVNAAALHALVAYAPLTEEQAKKVVIAIARAQIPAVSIAY